MHTLRFGLSVGFLYDVGHTPIDGRIALRPAIRLLVVDDHRFAALGIKRYADNCPDIEVLASQTAEWNREKAQTVTETFLTQFGDDIDGVYAFDDGMALGVVSALQGAGKAPGEIKVVSCNQFGEGWDAMREGWISGSGKQSPIDDAILAIQTAIRVANGIEVPELQEIERAKITPENVDEFERPTW